MSVVVAATSINVCQACVAGTWSVGNSSTCNICGFCPYWSYPPSIFFNVWSLQPVAVSLNSNVNFALIPGAGVLMTQASSLWYVDLALGATTYVPVTVPGVGGPFVSLASSRIGRYAYAVQGIYVYRIDLLRGQWDTVYPSALATCIVEDETGLVWIAQPDGVRALDAVTTSLAKTFLYQGSHHVCVHPLYADEIFITGSYGLKRVNKTTGLSTDLLSGTSYTVCSFTPDGNFIVLSQPDTQTAWAYSIFDTKLTKILTNAVITDILIDSSTMVLGTQNSGIQNVTYSFNDSRACGPGKYSLYSGLQLESQCQVCPVGSLCPGGSNITQCAAGTYSTDMGNREQAQCTICPAGFACGGGSSMVMCPIGTYSPLPGLDQPYNCPICEAGYFCPNATTRMTCPPNTMSDSGASDLGQCICDAGYRCIYVRVVHIRVTLPVCFTQFTEDMRNRYALAVALAAGVDVSNVQIVSVHQVTLSGGRRLLGSSSNEGVEIHTSVYGMAQDADIKNLDTNLNGVGLPTHHAFHMAVHMEVVDSIKL
jgi:hypothetical protein